MRLNVYAMYISSKEIEAQGKKGKELVVFEGTVLDAQPLTAIPLQQYTMEDLSYPSEEFYDSCMETQTHILSLVMEISNGLGDSVDEVKKGEKRLGEASCGVEANQEKNDGDQANDD